MVWIGFVVVIIKVINNTVAIIFKYNKKIIASATQISKLNKI